MSSNGRRASLVIHGFQINTSETFYDHRRARFAPVPQRVLPALTLILEQLQAIVKKNQDFQQFFLQIGFGMTFKKLLDRGIRISYSDKPHPPEPLYVDKFGGREICLKEEAYEDGTLQSASDVVHELCHCAGVRGDWWPKDRWAHARAYQAQYVCTGQLPEVFANTPMAWTSRMLAGMPTNSPR